MGSWRDYISQAALLPAAGWLFAMAIAIRSLWSPDSRRRRWLEIVPYTLVTLAVVIWFDINGAQTLKSNRQTLSSNEDMRKEVQTLLAVEDVSSKDGLSQGLDRLITRNLQPQQIIPTQEEELAKALMLIRPSLPNPLYITRLESASPDWVSVAVPIQRALERNGIEAPFEPQIALSPDETGLMFTMPDPTRPPEFALKLRDAFGLAGIRDIRFVQMASSSRGLGFTIFVGPAPLR